MNFIFAKLKRKKSNQVLYKMTDDQIEAIIAKPMTDADLERYTGVSTADIIKYSDLKNYNSLEELLPTDKSFRIILIEDKYNSGHWVAVVRYSPKTFCYFNSYGTKWDTDWKFINRMIRVILGEGTNEMTRLMKKAEADGWKTEWNHKKFQRVSSTVQTCGRWVIFFIEMMKMGYTLKEFQDFVKQKAVELGKPYDFIVSKFIHN